MNWRRKHRSCFCEVLLPRILKQQKTLTALYKCKFSNQTRSEKQTNVHNGKKTNGNYNRKKTATAINYNRKKTSTVRRLQQKENYIGKNHAKMCWLPFSQKLNS